MRDTANLITGEINMFTAIVHIWVGRLTLTVPRRAILHRLGTLPIVGVITLFPFIVATIGLTPGFTAQRASKSDGFELRFFCTACNAIRFQHVGNAGTIVLLQVFFFDDFVVDVDEVGFWRVSLLPVDFCGGVPRHLR